MPLDVNPNSSAVPAELEKAKRERKSDPILIYSTGMVYVARAFRGACREMFTPLKRLGMRDEPARIFCRAEG
jgi:hypothetical protein